MLDQQAELSRQQELLAAELRRSNLDRDLDHDQGGGEQERGQGGGQGGGGQGGGQGDAAAQPDSGGGGSGSGRHGSTPGQTRDVRARPIKGVPDPNPNPNPTPDQVSARLIKGMPLYDGARQGLDVTLIDTPGYGDLLVDTLANSSADKVLAEVYSTDYLLVAAHRSLLTTYYLLLTTYGLPLTKVVAEVERRISTHLDKERASRADMPLDDEKKFWNGLVHHCLFFV